MADISTRMSVTGLSEYKRSMNEAKEAVKTLDAQLKLNEAQYKANGDAELYMSNKAGLLKAQIEEQTKVVQNANAALQQMNNTNTNKSSQAYQKMQQNVYSSTQKLVEMKAELANIESGSKKADTELGKIGKNVAWQNVTSGLKEITDHLERGARAAINFGKKIAKSAMDSTGWADDILERATKYGVDAETLQKMDNVADYIDTDVDAIISAKDKLARSRSTLPELLGITEDGKSAEDLFWEVGDAIMALGEGFDKSEYAQKVFGRSWRELMPLFTAGREEYEALMSTQNVLTEEQVQKLGAADDAIKSLQQQVELMKNQFWAENADKIMELMQWIVDNKDGIVAALTAIAGGFGLIKIGEFAANIGKTVTGMKELMGLGGAGGTAGGASGSGWLGGGGGMSILSKGSALGLTGAMMLAPAFLTKMLSDMIPEENKLYSNARVQASTYSQEELDRLREWVSLQNELVRLENDQNVDIFSDARYGAVLDQLGGMNVQQGDLWNRYWDYLAANDKMPGVDIIPADVLDQMAAELAADPAAVPVEPEVPADAASIIAAQIGTVAVAIEPYLNGQADGEHANGLPWVPYDGYLSVLHKGERVLTASQNRNYTYYNNTYFGGVNLNNGMEIDALVDSIDRHNRRKSSGFGE